MRAAAWQNDQHEDHDGHDGHDVLRTSKFVIVFFVIIVIIVRGPSPVRQWTLAKNQ